MNKVWRFGDSLVVVIDEVVALNYFGTRLDIILRQQKMTYAENEAEPVLAAYHSLAAALQEYHDQRG